MFPRSGISQFSLFEDHKGLLRPAARFFLSSRGALLLVRHAISDEPRPSSGTFYYYSVDTWPAITSAPFHTQSRLTWLVDGEGDLGRWFAGLTTIFLNRFNETEISFIYLRRFHLPSQMLSCSIFLNNFIPSPSCL